MVPVDVIHPGDVVEHLTAPLDVLRVLVGLLRPKGWLLAQGPLEAGPCVFSAVLRGARKLRSTRPVEMPPYHVLQATVVGHRVIFERAGLEPLNSTVGAEVTAPLDWRRGASAIPDHDRTTEPTSVLEVGAETVL